MSSVFRLWLYFWLPSLLVGILSFLSATESGTLSSVPLSVGHLWIHNSLVCAGILLSGRINQKLPYLFYGYNSIFFSLILSLSASLPQAFSRLLIYGPVEVAALALATYFGAHRQYRMVWILFVLLLLAAFLEQLAGRF
ncbi:hypothetical protein STRDD13_01244 [Streptococcus sp. DD13]|nr:hypothetical protein STRDD13_01244 [Streptococcus sp. DD13]